MTYSWKKGMTIDDQWQAWLAANPIEKMVDIDTDKLKDALIKDLSFVSAMDVKEYTLYQKWCEVHDKYPTEETSSFFIDRPVLKDATQEILLTEIKNNFWLPEDPEEYLYLEPELVYTGGDGEEIKSVTGSKSKYSSWSSGNQKLFLISCNNAPCDASFKAGVSSKKLFVSTVGYLSCTSHHF